MNCLTPKRNQAKVSLSTLYKAEKIFYKKEIVFPLSLSLSLSLSLCVCGDVNQQNIIVKVLLYNWF